MRKLSVNNISATAMNTSNMYVQAEGVSSNNKTADIEAVIQKNTGEVLNTEGNINIDKTLKGLITDALKAAGLPVNDRMMELVKSLLDRQQPIDKNTLTAYNRLMGQHPRVSPETLIAMQKNGLHISKETIEQFENYKNSENQLFKNIDAAAGDVGVLVKDLISENADKAIDLLNGLSKLVNDMGQQPFNPADTSANNVPQQAALTLPTASDAVVIPDGAAAEIAATVEMTGQENDMVQNSDSAFMDALMEEFGEHLSLEHKERLSTGNLFEKISIMLEELPKDKAMELAEKLDTKEFAGFVKEVLKDALFLEPETVADKEKLTEYYKKLETAVKEFLNVTKELGDGVNNSVLVKSFDNVSDNVMFMNQINEYMPYVQLPLKLLKEEAHGEFYVMKRRKQQQQGDTITAFLRLNMQHLGELDIMVKLKERALNIDFKLEKDESVHFIGSTIGSLEQKLKDRGYIVTTSVGKKEKEFDFEKDFLEAESNEGAIGRYSFDMKI